MVKLKYKMRHWNLENETVEACTGTNTHSHTQNYHYAVFYYLRIAVELESDGGVVLECEETAAGEERRVVFVGYG